MVYTLSIQETHYKALTDHIFPDRTRERAAYLLCSLSSSDEECRLLVQEVMPVLPDDIEESSEHHMVIRQASYLRAIKKASRKNQCFVFVHSHPKEFPHHSPQDDKTERPLFNTAYIRIHRENLIHGSLVLSDPDRPFGRVWLPDQTTAPISRIRVIGQHFRFYDEGEEQPIDVNVFSRQILAFGETFQKLLRKLHIGIVGLGGTGSAVCEQLIRLGAGRLTVCDPQSFESSNINRVYGSRISDDDDPKAEVAARQAKEIGLDTQFKPMKGAITDLSVVKEFKGCDIIFGCTDDEWGRAILTRLSPYYLIPVFDMGVKIDSEGGKIKSVRGRVTTLVPGSPCLYCRGVVTQQGIDADVLSRTNPEEYERRRRDGYVVELQETAPAVIMFTSTVASTAVSEMLHRFTGYMGLNRTSTEVIHRFDESRISTNSKVAIEGCWCTDSSYYAVGDKDPLLELVWIDAN